MDEVMLHPAVAAVASAARGDDVVEIGGDRPVGGRAHARLLDDILQGQGSEGLLVAGRHLDVVASEPLVLALLNSDSPGLLFDKIGRLNRFLHSRHRHRVRHLEPRRAELEHWSTSATPPSSAESLFVCGLYLELLARIGCRGLSCAFPEAGSGARDAYCDGHPVAVPRDHTSRWSIGWVTFEPARPLPGLDELLLRSLPADLTALSVGASVEAVARRDLSRTWKVAAVASQLSVSPRTLQRRLLNEGRSFTQIIREARVDAAKELLREPTRTVTDIGYVTGFADTAHFTRTFKSETGATPTDWRKIGRAR
jgi:AraC-like DNA-binding protein